MRLVALGAALGWWWACAVADTTFLRCNSRAAIYGAAWLAPKATLLAVPPFPNKDALEFATFHLHAFGTGLKAADESFWVNHVSGYEHNLWPRFGDAVTKDRVTQMVKSLQNEVCAPRRDAFHAAPPGSRTLVVASRPRARFRSSAAATAARAQVPYHGGANRNVKWNNATKAELAAIPNTGTAHSRADRGVKLRTLHAVLCPAAAASVCPAAATRAVSVGSGLRVAARALVGVCHDRDADDVRRRVFARLPEGRAAVVVLDCADAPVYLPPALLRAVQRALGGDPGRPRVDAAGVDFVLYDEADQTLHFDRGPGDAFGVLGAAPRAFVAPQRYEKRWGADPLLVARANLSKSMNKCVTTQPAIRYPPST